MPTISRPPGSTARTERPDRGAPGPVLGHELLVARAPAGHPLAESAQQLGGQPGAVRVGDAQVSQRRHQGLADLVAAQRDVEPDSDDDGLPRHLGEDAGQLSVTGEHVVGPLQGRLHADGLDRLGHGKTGGQG